MSSIPTNVRATSALQVLHSVRSEMETRQRRIATGLAVASTKDDSAKYIRSQDLRGQLLMQQSVGNTLDRWKSTTDVAIAGAETISDVVNRLQEKALSLQEVANDPASTRAVRKDIEALIEQIGSVVDGSSFSGTNLLKGKSFAETVTRTSYSLPASSVNPSRLLASLGASQNAGAMPPDSLEQVQTGIRSRIDTQYATYFTAKSGAPTLRLLAAQKRVSAAAETLAEAERREGLLEAAFTDLDTARRQLATLRRDIEDDPDAAERADVLTRLETARGAAQQLATRKAESAAAASRRDGLEDFATRHAAALERQGAAQARQDAARVELAGLAAGLDSARNRAETARSTLDSALVAREAARTALAEARAREAASRRRGHVAAAHGRLADVAALEAERAPLDAAVALAVPAQVLEDLAAAERDVVRHRTLLEADGTRVELVGAAPGLTRDGAPLEPGEWMLTRETRIGLPGGGELVLRPSQALGGAQAALDAAAARRAALLAQWHVGTLGEAQARADAAREARRALETLAARILAAAPADRELDLAAGPEPLRAFVAAHPLVADEAPVAARPVAELEAAQDRADTAFVHADAQARQAEDDLRDAEKAQTPLAIEERTAASDLARVAQELAALAAHADYVDLAATLAAARETAASASVALQQAEANARAFDETALTRRLETLAARRRAADDRRGELATRIARLEAQVESDGGKGLAEQAAAAREEDEAARAALTRIEEEAETVKLLRDTLAEAQAETARSITGPVASRAARYVGRILPGGEPAFGDDLGLSAIRRAGVEEACEQLSKGTQEQLAILTRLAFADMLLEEGRPVSLILDDPLVYSDDVRLDAMTDLILEASQRMQVILLTCRERAFRHVEGNRVRM